MSRESIQTDIKNFLLSIIAGVVANTIYELASFWFQRWFRTHPETNVAQADPQPHQYLRPILAKATLDFTSPISPAAPDTFWGLLEGGQEIAVKRLDPTQEGSDFLGMVGSLSQIHHNNVVPFLGYCSEVERLVVHELMHHRSLRDILDDMDPLPPLRGRLSWSARLQIAADAAKGIDYIHRSCGPITAHGDLKSCNILIDRDMRARISGLLGAISRNGMSSPQDDIHALGIVLLELITGQRAGTGETRRTTVAAWVTLHFGRGGLQVADIIDPFLHPCDMRLAEGIAQIAIKCMNPLATQRPAILDVLRHIQHALFQEGTFKS